MGRKETIPDYDLPLLTLARVAEMTGYSDQKIRRAARYGHLCSEPRMSEKQPLRFRRTEVTRWVAEGASAQRPDGFKPERTEPEHLRRHWRRA